MELKNVTPEIQQKFDEYLERIKNIKWFQSQSFDKEEVEKQIKFAIKCFGVSAEIEWRKLGKNNSAAWGAAWSAAWGAARDAAWGAARGAALDAALDAARGAARGAALDAAWYAARDAAWYAARDAAWDAARYAARDAAWGAAEIVVSDLPAFNQKYPDGAFLQLMPLWELGLYPIGVINGKFIIYEIV